MTPLEAAALCRFTKAACPQQAIDEYTPDVWHPLLEDLRFEDARDAVVAVGRKQPFVAPSEIRAEVRRVRNARIDAFGPLPSPPVAYIDNPNAEMAWKRDLIRRIADGEDVERPAITTASPEYKARLDALLAGGFQEVPDED